MERFDPSEALKASALAAHGWAPREAAANGFGERAIGELVRAIVARLPQHCGDATTDD